jgi:hypothetical protein
MNNELQEFARKYIKDGLSKLSEQHVELFKRMYAKNGDISLDINVVVERMPEAKLDCAMQQIKRTIAKLSL